MTWEWRSLREARQVWQEADRRLRVHLRECIPCVRARRHRNPDLRCDEGSGLTKNRDDAKAELDAERRHAKEPIPGQQELELFGP